MDNFRQYIFRLICMAVVCTLAAEFFENGSSNKKLMQFVMGILMTIVAVTPFLGKHALQFELQPGAFMEDTQYVISAGQEQADQMLRQIITDRTQAYILDKAASMGAEISAEVILSDTEPPTPETVILTGGASPYVRKQLMHMIASEMEISEDNLQWN